MTKTPEGFLICRSVPIGRLGSQDYLGQEIGLDDRPHEQVKVQRTEAEVFAPAAMASFEGKPFTDEHPPEEVSPDNANDYIKGMVRDVRRGQGEESDLLLADIIVYDTDVISQIEQGKREVSCGYNCIYEPLSEHTYQQTSIIGNHVALVRKGRAGERVAIQDEYPKRRDKTMAKHTKQSVWGRMIQAFATTDASPEDMEVAVDEMAKACGSEEAAPAPQAPVHQPAPPAQDEVDPMAARMDKLEAVVTQLVQAMQPQKEPDALDALESELKGSAAQAPIGDEESATIEAETMNENNKTVDSAALLGRIAALKPIVAQIQDPTQRKLTSDTLAAVLRQGIALPAPTASNGVYAAINQAVRGNVTAKKQVMDSAADDRAWGKEIAAKYNPHYKKEAN